MMTQEQIEGNKLIAEFMGEKIKVSDANGFQYVKGAMYPQELSYHSSWDWLMPVAEKIQNFKVWKKDKKELEMFSNLSVSIDFDGYYDQCHCIITGSITKCHDTNGIHSYTEIELDQVSIIDKENIKAVWLAVVEFIKWYNQNK